VAPARGDATGGAPDVAPGVPAAFVRLGIGKATYVDVTFALPALVYTVTGCCGDNSADGGSVAGDGVRTVEAAMDDEEAEERGAEIGVDGADADFPEHCAHLHGVEP
jgi:hypothetical protein